MAIPTGEFYLISHYGAGYPMNRYGSGAYADNQSISLWDDATQDQKFILATINGKQRIRKAGSNTLGLNVYRSGNLCTLHPMVGNDNDSQVSIVPCTEGITGCYYIYLTHYGKATYTLTAPSDLKTASAKVNWKPYHGGPEQIWRFFTSHSKGNGNGHGRQLPSRPVSPVNGFIWPCYKKTGIRGFIPNSHYGIDRDSYYKQSTGPNAPGDPVYPICNGTVVNIFDNDKDFGHSVWINSTNPNTKAMSGTFIRHLYMHFNGKPKVTVGQSVSQSTLLGYMGATGDASGVHLHLGVQTRGTAYTQNDRYTIAGFQDPALILK